MGHPARKPKLVVFDETTPAAASQAPATLAAMMQELAVQIARRTADWQMVSTLLEAREVPQSTYETVKRQPGFPQLATVRVGRRDYARPSDFDAWMAAIAAHQRAGGGA